MPVSVRADCVELSEDVTSLPFTSSFALCSGTCAERPRARARRLR